MAKKIFIEQQIPFLEELVGSQAQCLRFQASPMLPPECYQGDAVIIRSANRLDYDQLPDSRLELVGTCSAGYSHVDPTKLKQQQIEFVSAPGSNAQAVASYVQQCFKILNITPDKKVGIIGAGQVGSLVAQQLQAQSFSVAQYDPFVFPENSLAAIYASEVILLHPALHQDKLFPSYHLVNDDFLQQLKSGAIVLNAARGAVVDEQAILKNSQHIIYATDVWEHEPKINLDTVKQAILATPHIAGHTWQAKYNASLMMYRALANKFNLAAEPCKLSTELKQLSKQDQHADLTELSKQFKEEITESENPEKTFSTMRKNYLSPHK